MKKLLLATAIATTLSAPASAGLFDKMNDTLKQATDAVNVELKKMQTTQTSQTTTNTTPAASPSFTVDDMGFCVPVSSPYDIKEWTITDSIHDFRIKSESMGAEKWYDPRLLGGPAGKRFEREGGKKGFDERNPNLASYTSFSSDYTIAGMKPDHIQYTRDVSKVSSDTDYRNRCSSEVRMVFYYDRVQRQNLRTALDNKFSDRPHAGNWHWHDQPTGTRLEIKERDLKSFLLIISFRGEYRVNVPSSVDASDI